LFSDEKAMSKLSELVSKGVRLIVTDVPPEGEAPAEDAPAREREIPAEAFDTPPPETASTGRSEVAADVADFGAVYAEAAIALPDHGYGVDKVAEMLEGKRLATLSREVKATAVMAALEAAGVAVRDVIQDAVKRDRALDAFEAAKQQEVEELRADTATRVEEIKAEIDAFLKEKNAELEQLKAAAEAAGRAFLDMQARKRQEEERLAAVVAHFLEGGDNPVTTAAAPTKPAASGAAAAPAPSKSDREP
jgi:hypothetical protein